MVCNDDDFELQECAEQQGSPCRWPSLSKLVFGLQIDDGGMPVHVIIRG